MVVGRGPVRLPTGVLEHDGPARPDLHRARLEPPLGHADDGNFVVPLVSEARHPDGGQEHRNADNDEDDEQAPAPKRSQRISFYRAPLPRRRIHEAAQRFILGRARLRPSAE